MSFSPDGVLEGPVPDHSRTTVVETRVFVWSDGRTGCRTRVGLPGPWRGPIVPIIKTGVMLPLVLSRSLPGCFPAPMGVSLTFPVSIRHPQFPRKSRSGTFLRLCRTDGSSGGRRPPVPTSPMSFVSVRPLPLHLLSRLPGHRPSVTVSPHPHS